MINKKTEIRRRNLTIITWMIVTVLIISFTIGEPVGPSIQYKGDETSASSGTATAETNSSAQGGDIITLILTARQQTSAWKAYVGNVSGTLVLEDSANYSIYEWSLSSLTGEVYATRTSSSVTWANVECANITHVEAEMVEMHHNFTNTRDDAINATFDDEANDHWGFDAGSTPIGANTCDYSINPYINDSTQTVDQFEEVLLYDGSANLIYVAEIEDNRFGYHTNSTYDFQMLVAENGSASVSQTDYYFYVELS